MAIFQLLFFFFVGFFLIYKSVYAIKKGQYKIPNRLGTHTVATVYRSENSFRFWYIVLGGIIVSFILFFMGVVLYGAS